MIYNQLNFSSGHSINCKGAIGLVDEVTEARKVVDKCYEICRQNNIEAYKYHDTSSNSKQNLRNIIDWHNKFKDGIDVSIHFNAYKNTSEAMGVEVLYYSDSSEASQVSYNISSVGFKNRGVKQRQDLYFLRNTKKKAILIEVCFCDSVKDVEIYKANFNKICELIVQALTNKVVTNNTNNNVENNKIYRVQVGAYKNKENAKEMQQKLNKLGIENIIV